ncbi:MAG: hypothetical protein ABGX26_01080 [Nautiliaceae bacterium]
MRLTSKEIEIIKAQVHKVLNDAQIYLFGSRVDDSLKGGDIELPKNRRKALGFIRRDIRPYPTATKIFSILSRLTRNF